MYNSATASKSAFWIPGSSMSNLRNQWIRIQHSSESLSIVVMIPWPKDQPSFSAHESTFTRTLFCNSPKSIGSTGTAGMLCANLSAPKTCWGRHSGFWTRPRTPLKTWIAQQFPNLRRTSMVEENCVAQWFITNITILTAWFLFVSSKDMLEKLASHVESNMGLLPQNHSPSGPHDAGPSHCGCCVFWQRKSWGSSSSHAADYSVVAPTLADAGGFRTSKLRTQKKLAFRLEFPYTFSQFVWFCHATNQQPLLVLVFSVRSQAN